ncbi:MAG: helix-turn-helix domain-containing protein [Pseudomonadota bacterium]
MLFVPLPLLATFVLVFLLGRFVHLRDMSLRAHQFFALLLALYAVQSLLVSLRWGYEIGWAAFYIALLAPVLPVCAYLAYGALSGQGSKWHLWPLGVVALNWIAFLTVPALADPLILLTYLGFGGLMVKESLNGSDQLPLSPISAAPEIIGAMRLTGVALIASALTDIYLIVDFIRNEGQSSGLVVTFMQTGFILAIGACAILGQSDAQSEASSPQEPNLPVPPSEADEDIVARLEQLFQTEALHKKDDISLRRLARRLGLSDRQVSNAINRVRQLSVSQFVNAYRIKEACALLRTTDLSVLEVSLSSGFATKSNFNREFSRITGKTPTNWRRENVTHT